MDDRGRELLQRASDYLLGDRIRVASDGERRTFEWNIGEEIESYLSKPEKKGSK